MRSSALSNDKVIEVINEFFVPITINVTKTGFPTSKITALTYLEAVYQTNWRFEFGFASCYALDDTGNIPLGMAVPSSLNLEENYSGKHYLEFMVNSLERYRDLKSIKAGFASGNFIEAGIKLKNFITSLQVEFSAATRTTITFINKLQAMGLQLPPQN